MPLLGCRPAPKDQTGSLLELIVSVTWCCISCGLMRLVADSRSPGQPRVREPAARRTADRRRIARLPVRCRWSTAGIAGRDDIFTYTGNVFCMSAPGQPGDRQAVRRQRTMPPHRRPLPCGVSQAPIRFIIQPRPGLSRARSLVAKWCRSHRQLGLAAAGKYPLAVGIPGGAAIKKRRVGPASCLTHAAPFHADVVTVLRGSAAASFRRLLPHPLYVKKCCGASNMRRGRSWAVAGCLHRLGKEQRPGNRFYAPQMASAHCGEDTNRQKRASYRPPRTVRQGLGPFQFVGSFSAGATWAGGAWPGAVKPSR